MTTAEQKGSLGLQAGEYRLIRQLGKGSFGTVYLAEHRLNHSLTAVKLLRFHLGVSLQRGEINDHEMQRLLVQAIYMTHRDWLIRPQA